MSMTGTQKNKLLAIKDLTVRFHTRFGVLYAVKNLCFHVEQGETVALVGESGCGKSVTALSIIGLLPQSIGEISGGYIKFQGVDLCKLPEKEKQKIRGSKISVIFQDPMTSLNPVFTIGNQMEEVFKTHEEVKKREARYKSIEMLRMVKIPDPERCARSYPHQLSGGMRQRVMIAMALSSPEPGLIIADEPTTALDVTIQAQILHLLNDLKKRLKIGLLLITHDMGVVAEVADRVVVMYAGHKVEEGLAESIFRHPLHPYSMGLLQCQCSSAQNRGKERLITIGGTVPNLLRLSRGCPFADRCNRVVGKCWDSFPPQQIFDQAHEVYCYNPLKEML